MSKRQKKRRRDSAGPSGGGTPKVNVKVVVADADLSAATRLVKPALLYADSVERRFFGAGFRQCPP